METKESSQNGKQSNRKKSRPAQRLYVPPAQRNKKQNSKNNQQCLTDKPNIPLSCDTPAKETPNTNQCNNDVIIKERLEEIPVMDTIDKDSALSKEASDLKNTQLKNVENAKISESKSDIDGEQEEMHRAIVNINRKTRPLIKHVSVVKNDILHIDVDKKTVCKLNIPLSEVSNWEDLFNEDDEINGDYVDQVEDNVSNLILSDNDNKDEDEASICKKNKSLEDLNHVIELYDFPASFRSHDIMQLYHEIQKETSMYIKWCDDTHALLVFSSPTLAQRALNITNDIIKSRPLTQSSSIALQTAMKSDLKAAVRRPPTTMQTARRLINTHLGTKTKISKEEQEKEREMLRKAKELKKYQRQSEKDAWEGFSRPSTA